MMLKLTGREVREKFLEFFAERDHRVVGSSSLVPIDDPTLLFTNAGMVQFKDVFLGKEKRDYTRATTVQRCVRAGGKHNDLENVGKTARHHTFFEMLGNFSFGEYFKKDAIRYAWDFLTKEMGLPEERLWATVYLDDDEAYELWLELTNVPKERILRLGEKDNFWAMGDTGPCGPCSEVVIDRGEEYRCDADVCGIGECDCDRWLELWNLVFMQFDRDEAGNLSPLPRPSIDTGMGLERLVSVLQGVDSNFDTDLFRSLIKRVEELTGVEYSSDEKGFPHRVIADHSRACTFLIADGVLPANEGRGYVLRRILRRAVRFGKVLGLTEPFLYRLVEAVIAEMGSAYPELKGKDEYIAKVIRLEEERFLQTLDQGSQILNDIILRTKSEGRDTIDGSAAFLLYDTYGFPLDLTEDAAIEAGLKVDKEAYEQALREQRERARAARGIVQQSDVLENLLVDLPETEFIGHHTFKDSGRVLAIVAGSSLVESISDSEVLVVLDRTPFYPEGGGQVGDKGVLEGSTGRVKIRDTRKVAGNHVIHIGKLEGSLAFNDTVSAIVDGNRQNIARNHTATHLLHKALKEVVGDHVNQAGSLVEAERLRFDFSHLQGLSKEELQRVEDLVNEQILKDLPVEAEILSLDEAKKRGAMALFGEKYGERVRMVGIADYSLELCGGIHVRSTGSIGQFKILSEGSIGSGIRRIEAITGPKVLQYLRELEDTMERIGGILKAEPRELVARVSELKDRVSVLGSELEQLKKAGSRQEALGILDKAVEVSGIRILATEVSAEDMETLRETADLLKDKLGSAVVVLGARNGEKAMLVTSCTPDAVNKGVHAGKLIGSIAKMVGGGGGGRPDMAQAGGKDATDLVLALKEGEKIAREMLE